MAVYAKLTTTCDDETSFTWIVKFRDQQQLETLEGDGFNTILDLVNEVIARQEDKGSSNRSIDDIIEIVETYEDPTGLEVDMDLTKIAILP